ncbi:MAG: Mur ligase family protein [Chloroflexota bacterium]
MASGAAEPPSAVVAALQDRGRFGIRLGLARTRALLAAVGSPERHVRGVLIGGTNGKGSTQAMVASVLRAAGLRVGQTPKPHLVSYRERIVVDGRAIDPTDLDALLAEVLAAADRVERRHGAPTEFEVLTTAAFLWLRRAGVDVAVIEVGLGGRLDATNAWDGGVAAITNVGLDHMEHLGTTVPAIAREKAAIIKRGDLAVTGATGEALRVIRRRASSVGAPLDVVVPLPVLDVDRGARGWRIRSLGELRLGLLGEHQAANAAVAIATSRRWRAQASPPRPRARSGAASRRSVGRAASSCSAWMAWTSCSTARTTPTAPVRWPRRSTGWHAASPGGRAALVLGVLADKDVSGMVGALRAAPALRDAVVLATPVPDTHRSLDAVTLAAAWGEGATPTASADDALALGLATAARTGGPLVVAGSLYLVGHLRARLTGGAVHDRPAADAHPETSSSPGGLGRS